LKFTGLAAGAELEAGLEEGEGFGAPKKDVMEPFALGFFAAAQRGTLEALRFRADMIMIVREKRRKDSLKCVMGRGEIGIFEGERCGDGGEG
jgi:hypothetical protein